METPSIWVPCDGCGVPASPDHLAERIHRLEIATRFRPIHTSVLFVAAAPQAGPESDFYGLLETRGFFDLFMDALGIPASTGSKTDKSASDAARLAEFQRRGYYLAYLSECPIPVGDNAIDKAIADLAPTLVRRIRFNYKPKHIAVLGSRLNPLLEILARAGISATVIPFLDEPYAGTAASAIGIQSTLAALIHQENLAPGL